MPSLLESMALLEDNYLGGSGSRGYGKIIFDKIKVSKRGKDYYKEAKEEEIIIEDANLAEVREVFKA